MPRHMLDYHGLFKNNFRKTNMTYMDQRLPLIYRFITWDRHIQNVSGLNMSKGANPPKPGLAYAVVI